MVAEAESGCLLENNRSLSSDRKQRFAVLYVIPPGFGRPVRRKFGQAIDPRVRISAENPEEPIGLARRRRAKTGENL